MKSWKCVSAGLLAASAVSASWGQASEPKPVAPGDTVVVERASNVRLAFFGDGHTWQGGSAAELKVGAAAADQLLLENTGGRVVVYLKSWMHNRFGPNSVFEVQEHTSDFDGNLKAGQRWKARIVAQGAPVDWCNSLTQAVTSEFEVGQPQDFTLKIDGTDTTISTLPVVERGQWNRCYSGKRYTKLLYAPALKTVVSLEHIGFNTSGKAHESSFRFDVKELRRSVP